MILHTCMSCSGGSAGVPRGGARLANTGVPARAPQACATGWGWSSGGNHTAFRDRRCRAAQVSCASLECSLSLSLSLSIARSLPATLSSPLSRSLSLFLSISLSLSLSLSLPPSLDNALAQATWLTRSFALSRSLSLSVSLFLSTPPSPYVTLSRRRPGQRDRRRASARHSYLYTYIHKYASLNVSIFESTRWEKSQRPRHSYVYT